AETLRHANRSWIDLADDLAMREDEILCLQPDAYLARRTFSGTDRVGGGAFERQFINLWTFGADGLLTRNEQFDADRDAEALARFDELTAEPAATARFTNAATRAIDRWAEAWEAHDWERIAAVFAPEFRVLDRRTLVHLDLDRDQHLESLRMIFEMSSHHLPWELLATRGERLALVRGRIDVADRQIGPSDVEFLQVLEVDAHGDRVASVLFDPADIDAAYAELDARYEAGEAASYPQRREVTRAFRRAFAERDWNALAALLAPGLVVNDHRILGWETLHGPEAYIQALGSLVDLAPDARLRIDHVEMSEHGSLYVPVWVGTREGGAFEAPSVFVAEFDGRERFQRLDQYDLDRLDQARTRFAELRPDPLRIPPNAATRAAERNNRAMAACDWGALEALCAPTLEFDDRRRGILTTGGRDMFIASGRHIGAAGTRVEPTVLATAGDRLALEHVRRSGDAPAFELENLSLTEVDADGRIVAVISFDPDDRRAASLELLDRYSRSDAAGWAPAAFFEFGRGLIDHELDRIRAVLPDDFVFHDRRRTGLGRIDGADDYIASLVALFEQSPDAIVEAMYEVATAKHGALTVAHWFGALAEGGAFESVFVNLALFHGDRLVGVELFELGDLEVARARFAGLGSDPA
ncbi:MAG: nuclear transport factor 2 family protein, partial [Candidatus Binatia bacterium]